VDEGALSRTGDAAVSEQDREEVLTRLLERFEAGRLEPDEYTRRVRAVELATSLEQLFGALDAAGDGRPVLDPVDALLLARHSQSRGAASRRPRYLWTGLLVVLLVVLMVVGLWLVARTRALHSSGSTGTLQPSALAHPGPA
jgi:hypothetical protein